MTDLRSLDAEQASMYRWIRKMMTPEMFYELTGFVLDKSSSTPTMDIDLAIRGAHERYEVSDATKALRDRSKLRSGVLPPELGEALQVYTDSVIDRTLFVESLGGRTYGDVDRVMAMKFKQLCEQIARIR